jgi:hypothetical protein
MTIRGKLASRRSVRSVFVRGARPVRERHFGTAMGYLPGYETVLVSEDVLERITSSSSEVRDLFLPAVRGHWELVGPSLPVVGCDSRDVLEGVISSCLACSQLFRDPREVVTVAVTDEHRGSLRVFAAGFANRIQLYVANDLYPAMGWRGGRTDKARSLPAIDTFDLHEIAKPFVLVAARR